MSITLIVEDGTKPASANTYVSLADADTYHTNLGNTDWPDTTGDEEKKQALILATQAIDLLYGVRYMSTIYPDSKQVLLWPRLWFMDANARIVKENTIPAAIKNAVCEVALMHLQDLDIFPQQSTTSLVKLSHIKIGDIANQTEYFKPAEGESFTGFRKVDITLRPVLKSAQTANWSLKA